MKKSGFTLVIGLLLCGIVWAQGYSPGTTSGQSISVTTGSFSGTITSGITDGGVALAIPLGGNIYMDSPTNHVGFASNGTKFLTDAGWSSYVAAGDYSLSCVNDCRVGFGASYLNGSGTSIQVQGGTRNISASAFGLTTQIGSNYGISDDGSNNMLVRTNTSHSVSIGDNGPNNWAQFSSSGLKVGPTGTFISSSIRGTATLDFASALTGACSTDLTITVTGALTNAEVSLGVPAASVAAGSDFFAWVSTADTVTVRHCCQAGTSCDPASGSFSARVFNP